MSGQEAEILKAKEQIAHREELAQQYYEADMVAKDADEEKKALKEEILLDFGVGATVCGPYIVELTKSSRKPTIDWEREIILLNGEAALADIKKRHAACAEANESFRLSVKKVAK